jgi:hypothetical protein
VVGAKLIVTFNQSLASASVPATISGASENRAATLSGVLTPTDVTITIPGIAQGALDTGSSSYFSGVCILLCSAQSATFNASVALVDAGTSTTVTLTVTSVTPGSGSTLGASTGKLVFVPASTVTDGGGDAAIGSLTTAASFALF